MSQTAHPKPLRKRAQDGVDGVVDHAPGPWKALIEHATRTHTLTLAAGLAFFGLISLAPAISFGFGIMRLALPDEMVATMAEVIQGSFPETLGLADLIDQMEARAGRYAGISLLVLLWPATTLASGWTRSMP